MHFKKDEQNLTIRLKARPIWLNLNFHAFSFLHKNRNEQWTISQLVTGVQVFSVLLTVALLKQQTWGASVNVSGYFKVFTQPEPISQTGNGLCAIFTEYALTLPVYRSSLSPLFLSPSEKQ